MLNSDEVNFNISSNPKSMLQGFEEQQKKFNAQLAKELNEGQGSARNKTEVTKGGVPCVNRNRHQIEMMKSEEAKQNYAQG